jgi:hypothetical protein
VRLGPPLHSDDDESKFEAEVAAAVVAVVEAAPVVPASPPSATAAVSPDPRVSLRHSTPSPVGPGDPGAAVPLPRARTPVDASVAAPRLAVAAPPAARANAGPTVAPAPVLAPASTPAPGPTSPVARGSARGTRGDSGGSDDDFAVSGYDVLCSRQREGILRRLARVGASHHAGGTAEASASADLTAVQAWFPTPDACGVVVPQLLAMLDPSHLFNIRYL